MELGDIRKQLDECDSEIVRLYEKRMKLSEQVACAKLESGKAVLDKDREREKLAKVASMCSDGLNEDGVKELFSFLMSMSRKLQYRKLSEGGRRLYSDGDLKRLKIICFLRNLDLSIDAVSQILKEEHPEKVISLLVEQQEQALMDEISDKEEKLEKLRELKTGLKDKTDFSLETIGDIAVFMEGKKKLKKMRWMMILTGIPVSALQWLSIIFWIVRGIWWPFLVWVLVAAVWGTLVSRYYFNHVKYICPECHEVFRPTLKEAFWANHTPTARRLTCTMCGHKGFCVEIWGGDGE